MNSIMEAGMTSITPSPDDSHAVRVRRRLMASLLALALCPLTNVTHARKRSTMNNAAPLKSLIQTITSQSGLAVDQLNVLLNSQFIQNLTLSDEYSLVYESAQAKGIPNLAIERAELRLPGARGRFKGILSVYLAEPGLAFDSLRTELPELTLLQAPRGRAIDEATVFGYPSNWGSISLEVSGKGTRHLTAVYFEPK